MNTYFIIFFNFIDRVVQRNVIIMTVIAMVGGALIAARYGINDTGAQYVLKASAIRFTII